MIHTNGSPHYTILMNVIHALLKIIENPSSKKGYADFCVYLEKNGMLHESVAITRLMEKRFGKTSDDIPLNQKQ